MSEDLTKLLERWSQGDEHAFEELVPLVYGELRRIARSKFQNERQGHTLQPTILVHDAFMEMRRSGSILFEGRTHFYACAARIMRHKLINHAKKVSARKRGGDVLKISLSPEADAVEKTLMSLGEIEEMPFALSDYEPLVMTDLERALEKFESIDPHRIRFFELSFFLGMGSREIAEEMDCSQRDARRKLAFVRRWLSREMGYALGENH